MTCSVVNILNSLALWILSAVSSRGKFYTIQWHNDVNESLFEKSVGLKICNQENSERVSLPTEMFCLSDWTL